MRPLAGPRTRFTPPGARNRIGLSRSAALVVALAAPGTSVAAQQPDSAARAAGVVGAMQHWIHVTQLVNADSAAAIYTPDAEMLQASMPPIHGRDAIHAFLKPFDGRAVVDSISGTAGRVDVFDSTAYLWGEYYQKTRIPPGAPQAYRGRFVTEWRLGGDGTWRIARILMQPAG